MNERRTIAFLMIAITAVFLAVPCDAGATSSHHAKNIIFMVPDGMGLSNVTAARIYWYGIGGKPLTFETLDHIGYQRTYSRNQTITDSAPAASAWACGEKFNDGEICFHGEGEPNPPSILQLAKRKGKKTGLVATSTITHATPAAFGAHVQRRNCEYEIARQYIEETRPDVMLGGGMDKFVSMSAYDKNSATCPAIDHGDLTRVAVQKGYTLVSDKIAMEMAVAGGARKLLGLFNPAGMLPECKRMDTPFGDPNTDLLCMDKSGPVATSEPRLADMTKAALEILEKDGDGFFLMVEGSQVDWANHANDFEYQLGEMLAFAEAVKTVRDWIDEHPARKAGTLLVVVADHDCGGMQINGPYGAGNLVTKGKITPSWTSKDHTGVDTIIWSQGPQSDRLARGALENTFLYDVMKSALYGHR